MLHTISATQFLKSDIHTVWDFMSSPLNLAAITPAYMDFKIIGPQPQKMYAGQIIEYYIKPVAGIRLHWATEITHVKDLEFFVDEQRFGPYAFWHHKHTFKVVNGGVEMTDVVHYKLRFGLLGRLVNNLFVKRQVKTIFDYRHQKMEALFNKP